MQLGEGFGGRVGEHVAGNRAERVTVGGLRITRVWVQGVRLHRAVCRPVPACGFESLLFPTTLADLPITPTHRHAHPHPPPRTPSAGLLLDITQRAQP